MNLYSTKRAGEILGLSAVTVQWYCRTYPEIGAQPGRNWVLTDEDLERIRHHQAEGPGPKGKGDK